MTLDSLLPQIEKAQSEGAIVLLKWDGERASHPCSVVITKQSSNYVWRKDCEDIASTLAQGLSEYRLAHDSQGQAKA